ncbi:non-homologous end-joining DNA ligase [Actinokineospora bangkokensis]|uniref:ATP-dependent DNA ligase n=1 Tax=Actinokineospora bangkokensis TaxID=1193682 RepID=A0A1Q9LQL2_9PSEU|nr:non-homologous end-joining DNA ligase [Actinokineospora bangkokensis]OLR94319.1 ATP-dependent DNA ligase [Actinokineospora bangkokensis]
MSGDKGETRDGVALTNLDQELFPGAGATKRDLVDYLDAVADRFLPVLAGRPLSVVRVLRGQDAFMQKNLPKYTPDYVRSVEVWAESSKRTIRYALCDDRKTLLWFGNQRAIEYHPTLAPAERPLHPTHLVLDIDPPEGGEFSLAVRAAELVRAALADSGLAGAVKTSGAKGLHIFVPVVDSAQPDDMAAAMRAIAVRAERIDPDLATTAFIRDDRHGKVFLDSTRAYGATTAAAYSPRKRPGLPVSFPLDWSELAGARPEGFTVHNAVELLDGRDKWAELMPPAVPLPEDLVAEGHTIPVARVQAMHEGKRRKRAAERAAAEDAGS